MTIDTGTAPRLNNAAERRVNQLLVGHLRDDGVAWKGTPLLGDKSRIQLRKGDDRFDWDKVSR